MLKGNKMVQEEKNKDFFQPSSKERIRGQSKGRYTSKC